MINKSQEGRKAIHNHKQNNQNQKTLFTDNSKHQWFSFVKKKKKKTLTTRLDTREESILGLHQRNMSSHQENTLYQGKNGYSIQMDPRGEQM